MIRVVFLDVGGTLIRPEPSVGAVYARVAERFGIQAAGAELEDRFRAVFLAERKRGGPIDKPWWRSVVALVFEPYHVAEPEALFDAIYDAFNHRDAWHIFPDVVPAMGALRAKGVRLAVASNWDERLPSLLQTLGLTASFDRIFYSHALGIAKPDPRFFTTALREMDVAPIEAIHVGDDDREDVACAQAAGLRAYQIDRLARPKNSRTVVDLNELLLRI